MTLRHSPNVLTLKGSGIYHSFFNGLVDALHFLSRERVTLLDAIRAGYKLDIITAIMDSKSANTKCGEDTSIGTS